MTRTDTTATEATEATPGHPLHRLWASADSAMREASATAEVATRTARKVAAGEATPGRLTMAEVRAEVAEHHATLAVCRLAVARALHHGQPERAERAATRWLAEHLTGPAPVAPVVMPPATAAEVVATLADSGRTVTEALAMATAEAMAHGEHRVTVHTVASRLTVAVPATGPATGWPNMTR